MPYNGRGRGYYGRGRGHGRGRGRGGRFRRSSSYKRRNNHNTSITQQKEFKFHPHTQGRQSYATYASVKELIIQNIQKGWEGGFDIGKSLRDNVKVDLTTEAPTRSMSNKTDTTQASIEQEGYNIRYQEELRLYLEREDILKKGLKKHMLIYMLISALRQCNKG